MLLVCSDTPMRQRLRGALQAQPGVRVLAAVGDGRLAVEQAVELGADVVVTAVAIPARDGGDLLKGLTAIERRILRLAADGKSNAEMADSLRLSRRTVETYRARLMRKLGLGDLPSLVKFAVRHGISALE